VIPTSVCPNCGKTHRFGEVCLYRRNDLPRDMIDNDSRPRLDPQSRPMPNWLIIVIASGIVFFLARAILFRDAPAQSDRPAPALTVHEY
jgi:hypothetical protein